MAAAHIVAALQSIFVKNMLYKKGKHKITRAEIETVIFADPASAESFIALSMQYNPMKGYIEEISCDTPSADYLWSEMGMTGKYYGFDPIPLDHPEAQRVLRFYKNFLQLNLQRRECRKNWIDLDRKDPLPSDEKSDDPPGNTPDVVYL